MKSKQLPILFEKCSSNNVSMKLTVIYEFARYYICFIIYLCKFNTY